MTQIPDTGGSAYCTPTQMLKFYDANLLGQLASDFGVPVPPSALLSDPNLLLALQAAAGEIELACTVAGRYRPQDLAALVAANGNGSVRLARLNADLAFAMMRERRGYRTEEDFPQIKRAFDLLDRLREGIRIFPFLDSEQAGVGSRQDQGATVRRTASLLTTTVARRYYGMRARNYLCPPGGTDCC